jgi:hypothetical protein
VESSLAGDQKRRFAMRVKVLLQITGDDGTSGDAVEVAVLEKQTKRPEDLGLSSCCFGLGGLSRIVVGEAGIPFLEERPECSIERASSGLQQKVRAALRPLHLLTFGKTLADDGVHGGLGQA